MGLWRSRAGAWLVAVQATSAGAAFAAPDRVAATRVFAPPANEHAIERALRLLPRRPPEVRVLAAGGVAPASRERFFRSEAFVSRGRPGVYLTAHGPTLRAASEGSAIHVHVLAAIIWHEMAHLAGDDEPAARRKEASLWQAFVRDARVERVDGLRHLARLVDRQHAAAALEAASAP